MTNNAARPITHIFPLDPDSRAWMRRSGQIPANVDDPFWPEVSSRYALEHPTAPNPDNRPARVLSEIAVVVGAACALAFVVWALLGNAISP